MLRRPIRDEKKGDINRRVQPTLVLYIHSLTQPIPNDLLNTLNNLLNKPINAPEEANPGKEGALLFAGPPRVHTREDQHILKPDEGEEDGEEEGEGEGEEEGEHAHVLVHFNMYMRHATTRQQRSTQYTAHRVSVHTGYTVY